mgnify:CR=1 FL=1
MPTSRGVKKGGRRLRGTYVEQRVAWVNIGRMDFALYVDEDDLMLGEVPRRKLIFRRTGSRSNFFIDLTDLNEDEHAALGEFLQACFEETRPLVQRLDQVAKEQHENGDDTPFRLYRQAPLFVDRRRQEPQDDQGVQE